MGPRLLTRRNLLANTAQSVGIAGLAAVLGGEASAASGPLAAKPPHFAPRAKRIIHLWMNGGPSQVDTFDPKPALEKFAGQRPGAVDVIKTERTTSGLMPSPFRFAKHGQSGMEISELLPHLARHADDLCVIRSMHTDSPAHEPANYMMFTGSLTPVRPSYGSWLLYGLGSLNENLPGFVVLGDGQPVNGASNWSNRFLPGIYQGCHVKGVDPLRDSRAKYDPRKVLDNLTDPYAAADAQRRRLDFAQRLNEMHLQDQGMENNLAARIASLELAFRMQTSAIEAFDISAETAATHDAYGITRSVKQFTGAMPMSGESFARNCLLARRLLERGVRVVQVYAGSQQPWDLHGNSETGHRNLCQAVDQPIAALLQDLKQQGLLDDTLVVWGGEFGRTPTTEGKDGRDHNPHGFTIWLAGGGVRGGVTLGATDDLGYRVTERPQTVYDLWATVLHLLGLDHERLTFFAGGRHQRLTDVHGKVMHDLIA